MDRHKIHMSGGLYFAFISDTLKMQGKKRNNKSEDDAKSNDEYFLELIRTFVLEEDIIKSYSSETIKSEINKYKFCSKKRINILPCDNESKRKSLYNNTLSNYSDCLQKMNNFIAEYIDLTKIDILYHHLELMTRIIIIDSAITSEQKFFIKTDATAVRKRELLKYFKLLSVNSPTIDLAAYMLGIGQFCILMIEDNRIAKDTCDWLFPPKGSKHRPYIEPEDITDLMKYTYEADPEEYTKKQITDVCEQVNRFAHGEFLEKNGQNMFLRPQISFACGIQKRTNMNFDINSIPIENSVEYIKSNLEIINIILETKYAKLSDNDLALVRGFRDKFSPIIDYLIEEDLYTEEVDFYKIMKIYELYEVYWCSVWVKFENVELELIKDIYLFLLNVLVIKFDSEQYWYGDPEIGKYMLGIFTPVESLEYNNAFIPLFSFCKKIFNLLKKHLDEYFITD